MRKAFPFLLIGAILVVSAMSLYYGDQDTPDQQEEVETTAEDRTEVFDASVAVVAFTAEEPVPANESNESTQEDTVDEPAPKTDYLAVMKACCLTGDVEAGEAAEMERNSKIAERGLNYPEICFEELYELSKVITNEAGSDWLSEEWKMMVGEVVLNRVASLEFPDTVLEVIHQRGQYQGANTDYFQRLTPYQDCVDIAARLLNGERIINDPSVVFQSSHILGSGIYREMYDETLGYTYFCYSERPELYQ
jgi:hypothetical protein